MEYVVPLFWFVLPVEALSQGHDTLELAATIIHTIIQVGQNLPILLILINRLLSPQNFAAAELAFLVVAFRLFAERDIPQLPESGRVDIRR